MNSLMFLGGFLLLAGVEIVSSYSKVLNDFKADVFKVDLLIVITSIAFQGTRYWFLPV